MVPESDDIRDLRDAMWQLEHAAAWYKEAPGDESAQCLTRALGIAAKARETSRTRELERVRQGQAGRAMPGEIHAADYPTEKLSL